MSEAFEPRRIESVRELGASRRRAHLSWQAEGAVRPSAHAGDPAQVGIVGAGERLQLLVHLAAGLWHNVGKRWDDVDAVQHGLHAHAAWAPQCWH